MNPRTEEAQLEFQPISLRDKELVTKYMVQYGEGSCQHGFVSMYSLYPKYGDAICEKDGFLLVHRTFLDHDDIRVYLAPMGQGDEKGAYDAIIKDAHSYGKKVEFFTLTKKYMEKVEKLFPKKFQIQEIREYAEYIYSTKKITTLSGKGLKVKRNEINQFHKIYGQRVKISVIQKEDLEDIWDYEMKWVEQNVETHDKDALKRECQCIKKQLDNYERLDLSGIVIRIDGQVCGFGYGTPLNNTYYDALIEKGDRNIKFIYRVLFQESVRLCALNYEYVNREEDLGIRGLRDIKLAYHPEILLKKYIAAEI